MNSVLRPLLLAALLAGCAARQPANMVELNLVALNDLHGNLEASRFENGKAGGVDTIAAALQSWRKEDNQLLLVGAGDMIGASPAMSAMWADEPTLHALDLLGMRATSVGNHEFDQGQLELLRQQKGGCVSPRPDKACQYESAYNGARFNYLAANVVDSRTNATLLPAYRIEEVKGVKVALIGAVLRQTPDLVAANGVGGLQFVDEATAINRLLPELRAQGASVFVVLIHQGGTSEARFDQQYCQDLKGDIVDVVRALDPAIRLVVSGHSHKGYLCRVGNTVVTQADMAGHMLSRIKLMVDRQTGQVVDVTARNVVMEAGRFGSEPVMANYLAGVRTRSAQALAVPVARLAVPVILRDLLPGTEESPLAQVVADSALWATRRWGSQIAFANTGGVRTHLETGYDNMASVGQVQAVLPFGNQLVVMNLSGAQIRTLLEQQWAGTGMQVDKRGLLQVSEGFTYAYDLRAPVGRRIMPASVMLNGVPLDDAASYRVAMNSFIADGGDGFEMFTQGSNRVPTAVRDTDALAQYLKQRELEHKPVGQSAAAPRITHLK
jgi:5'-nucleotidase